MLPLFGAIPDAGRVVRDGNVITGGGVTAGIDFALVVAAELSGETFAQALQLNIEYAPAPPFELGSPGNCTTGRVGDVPGALRETSAGSARGRESGGGEDVRSGETRFRPEVSQARSS